MKILRVHNYYKNRGGEATCFHNEVELLKKNGQEVVVYTRNNKDITKMFSIKNFFNAIWSKQTYREIADLIEKEKPEIVHFDNIFPLVSPSAYYAVKKKGIPVIQTLHNYRLLCANAMLYVKNDICEKCAGKALQFPGVLNKCYKNSYLASAVVVLMNFAHRLLGTRIKKVDHYFVPSEFAKNKLVHYGMPENKISVKANVLSNDPGVGAGIGENVIYVGRLSQEKGIHSLIKAWSGIKDISLTIVGDGPMRSEVEEYLFVNDLKNVKIKGLLSHAEVLELVKQSRILIFPSEWYEVQPFTLIEAFACGKPVVAGRIGVMSDFIEENRTGIFFETKNSTDLAEKVVRLYNDVNKVKELGINCRIEYEAKYTNSKIYNSMMSVYGELAMSSSKKERVDDE
ncbi:MAG: glycosyltransferase family 4 protein [Candidatus Omnitrophica bacterium]|nr:glycosyltransferase family 4 protein [Candidatus Omnitrophota bacterium]